VVDVTHPAFAISITDTEQKTLVEKFLRDGVPMAKLPNPLRELALRFLLRQSVLALGIGQARNSFMSGMQTYLLKLGPEMLGSAYAKPIHRPWSGPFDCDKAPSADLSKWIEDVDFYFAPRENSRPVAIHQG
jgi:hypothetical protein